MAYKTKDIITKIIFSAVFWVLLNCCCVAMQAQNVKQNPSLIPLPQSVQWSKANFSLYQCKAITVNNTSLKKLAVDLQKELRESGISVKVDFQFKKTAAPVIELRLGKVEAPSLSAEAYHLNVTKNKIALTANTAHGIFNGLETLRQLINRETITGCTIRDWPAFSWRGYMVDVGRNYQSIKLLKQQIDVMSWYKLNVFHFHPTEDIAWRIAIKQYPQLTEAKNMLRNKGQYYSEKEMKDLIKYCRERFITFVPEIDMPGHSAAFTRAFGVDMQSKKGFSILKNIITEFNSTYHIPYLHIGADEVKFTNKNFIPEITDLIHQQGKQTIGWYPGGNYDDSTIRQLWESKGMDSPNARYIDSRSLYLNHMDPEESVVSIFERQICDTIQGNAQKLGGEICLWNDHRAANENDLLRMNPVYPSILAFAERSWRGGGFSGVVVNIGNSDSDRAIAFKEFEGRLINHKHEYFTNLPFPYVRQSNIQWKLFGPFENQGNLEQSFWPENKNISITDSLANKTVSGGTIYLRHWWFPQLTSWLENPKENTTWYAYMKIWKDKDTTGFMWIGFNNFSRSTATDPPARGTWDNRKSSIWLNGNLIAPPRWKEAGSKSNSETPLTDEGYEFRTPSKVHFQKGWNMVLVKLPVNTFHGKDWQNPVKWMFTAVPVHKENGINWNADEVKTVN
ncbi:MAG: beta-N-acetylhexosaminidase [Bacteroidota bacterium]|nr:beta-N-acetylhexosaminidase [Bacteroidota bacterium]